MALDATVAGASANSYLTVEDADALARADLGPQADRWLHPSTTLADKEKALQRATREIDAYVDRLGVAPYSADQALLFPRETDVAGDPLAPFLPRSIKQAAYEQATYVLTNAPALDEAAGRRAKGWFSYSNPDGTGGSLAADPLFGRLAPSVQSLLLATFRRSTTVATVRIRSSFEPTVTS